MISRDTTLAGRPIRAAITLPSTPSAIPREISSRSASVTILRSPLTWYSSSTVSPTIYTKINFFDRLGSSWSVASIFSSATSPWSTGRKSTTCAGRPWADPFTVVPPNTEICPSGGEPFSFPSTVQLARQ
ncbi:MAG: hypothetical protein ACRDRU_02975 [Pseudonocardiaceae bacterium]